MKLTFIGCGNMGQAMLKGILSSEKLRGTEIIATARSRETLARLEKDYGIHTTEDNKKAASWGDIVILAVKPQMYEAVLGEIKEELKDKLIVSIAAGKSLRQLEELLGTDKKLIRAMPNTPAMVLEGITALCPNKNIEEEELNTIEDILSAFGKTEVIEEKQMDAFIGICGSSPAYVFMFIEALADGAVKEGLPRAKAYRMAAQAVLGSAKLVLESGKHPGELKDMVCSPGGTTIEAVAALEEYGFRSSVIKAVERCSEKSRTM
ncbi:pyrroline-5-carboxylate reductase [Alloiococcus sp. CFN-8]|uniref:pyrroline-5-carboxylate reductase n=1 Tax=Alloiococcus sp. CFN-8 TaxID=3416081 RepID=UPI003CF20FBC